MYNLIGYNNNGYSNNMSLSNLQINTKKSDIRGSYNLYDVVKNEYVNKSKKASTSADLVAESKDYQRKEIGEELYSSISKLTSHSSSSAFNKTVAKSSDTDVVTFDNTKSTAKKGTEGFTIKVDKVATAQVNSGEAIKSTNKDVASSSSYSPYKFEINVDGKNQSFKIDVAYDDDNKSIQNKIAKAINSANIGVSASVENKNGTTKLSVASKNTGISAKGDFTIKDVDGNLAAKMGITAKSQNAQNAEYRIGNAEADILSFGATKTSTNNTIDVGNGIKATLKSSSGDFVKVTYGKESSVSTNAVKDFVSSLNSALSSAKSATGKGSSRLYNDITGMNKTYKNSLARIGVDVKKDGSLSIDEAKLKDASENGSLEKFYQEGLGFSRRASSIASNLKSGSYYADPVASIKNSSQNSYYNPYGSTSSLFNLMM